MRKNLFTIFVFVTLLSAALPLLAQRPTNFKDMDSVRRIYMAPIVTEGEEPSTARFRAALKGELVRNGFVVLDKAEGTDATLMMELVVLKNEKAFTVETHASLDAGPENRASWNNGTSKTGPDLDRLLADRARYIAQSLKSYRTDVITKLQDKKEKEAKH